MESEEENDQIFQKLKKQKSVTIADDKTEIVEIREKHGPLYLSIPKLPISAAVTFCLLNIVLPGVGTFISAFTVLCGAPTALNKRTAAFLFNLLSAFLQMITFIIIVGWVWSILWGMNMVTLAMNWGEEKRTPYYCRRQSSIDVP
ncbi:protein stum homolog isoform X2 [Ruditapes philippinarum]|uniref:protein stum homolog isoform X2 n=1 Tax=Ruditapes philippinarum TaxID=129788 RepID=UPI00295C2DA9|nr:protein stum homolog isoform X2 [Ruditapes philippinarum]